MKLLGVILAGGQARRMGGGDKGTIILGGLTMLDRVIDRFGPQVDRLVLNANGNPDRFIEYGLPVVQDTVLDYPGPLAGVLAGMEYAAAHAYDYIATVAADTPFFPTDGVDQLVQARDNARKPIALAASREADFVVRHPTFGIWPVSYRKDLKEALDGGMRKVVQWTDMHGTAQHVFPADAFFNINTPEDLAEAELRLQAGVS
jgi:molybdopterin-guanine dinucleotide biosynthesis protein A